MNKRFIIEIMEELQISLMTSMYAHENEWLR